MSALARRPESSHLVYRQRVPCDVLERVRGRVLLIDFPAVGSTPEASIAVKVRDTLKVILRARDPEAAKARQGAMMAHLARVWASIRQGPASLTHEQLHALAGDVYRHLVDLGDDPGTAVRGPP